MIHGHLNVRWELFYISSLIVQIIWVIFEVIFFANSTIVRNLILRCCFARSQFRFHRRS